MHRRWILVHAWIGFGASLILVIVAVSGTLLVFKDDWTRITVPGAAAAAPLDEASLARIAEAAETHFGPGEVSAVRFATADLGVHRLYLRDGGGAYLDGAGRVVEQWSENGRIEDWLLDLHYTLMAGETGELLTGLAALVSTFLVITGFIVWWPVRRGYRHRFWPASLHRAELLRVHRNTGVWSVVPIAVLSISGAAMIFDTQATALLNGLFGSGERPSPMVNHNRVTGGPIDWQTVLAAGRRQFPDGTPRIASWESQFMARVRYRQPAEWHPNGRSVLYYRVGEGVIDHVDATRLTTGTRVYHAMYPIHSARIGGPLYAVVVVLSGLGMALLGLFGAWSFLRKPRRVIRHSPGQNDMGVGPQC